MADDRQIALAGTFRQNVDVVNSLTNGESCSASDWSHAEGYRSEANGSYSHAEGYMARAIHSRSFVWSGRNDGGSLNVSKGEGKFTLYPQVNDGDELEGVYIKDKTLSDCVTDKFGAEFSNASLRAATNQWNAKNTFRGGLEVASGGGATVQVYAPLNVGDSSNATMAQFYGSLKGRTASLGAEETAFDGGDLAPVATTVYVKKAISAEMDGAMSSLVKVSGDLPVGSSVRPVYVDDSGAVKTVDADVVFRTTDSVGNGVVPVYLSGGSLVQSSYSVGGSAQSVCLSGGSLTACTVTAGSGGSRMVYFDGGVVKESTKNVGGTDQSSLTMSPVYLSNGSITAFPNGFNIGGARRPVYVENGKLKVCSVEIPSGGGGGGGDGISSIGLTGCSITSRNFLMGLSNRWYPQTRTYEIVGSLARPTLFDVYGLMDEESGGMVTVKGSLSAVMSSCASLKSSVDGNANKISSLATNLPIYYCPSLKVTTSGSGNIVTGLTCSLKTESGSTFANMTVYKESNAITSVNSPNTGYVVTGMSQSGGTLNVTKSSGVIAVNTGSKSDSQYVNNVTFTNGSLSFGWGTPSGGSAKFKIVQCSTTQEVSFPAGGLEGNHATATAVFYDQDGYTPVGIVGVVPASGPNLGLNSFYLSGSTASAVFVNHRQTTAVKSIVTFYILAVK